MARFIYAGDFCDRLAVLAKAKNMQQLSAWLKLAANECHLGNLQMCEPPAQFVGVWDWDVGNNRTYADEVCGSFFGHHAKAAAGGLPLERFTDRIYPDDIPRFRTNLQSAMKQGVFQAEYRVIAKDRARWVRAQGNFTLDSAGKPLRGLGSIVDITRTRR